MEPVQSHPRSRWLDLRATLMVLVFLAVVSGLTFRTVRHLHGPETSDQERWGMIDFRDVIYYPTRAVLEGVNPYDSEQTTDPTRYRGRYPVGNLFPLYSPLLILLDLPLQLLTYHAAMVLYGLWNVSLVVLIAWAALRASEIRPSVFSTFLLATLMFISRPGQSSFYFGQVAAPMALAFLGAVYWAPRHPGWAAVALALTTIKISFGAPLLMMMLCWRQWKTAIWGGTLGGGAALIGFLLIFTLCHEGPPPWDVLRTNQQHLEHDPGFDAQETGFRLDAVAVVERIVGPEHSATAKLVTPLAILAVTGLVLWLLSANSQLKKLAWPTIPLIHVTALVWNFHAAYDALLLTWPLVSLACGPCRRSDAHPLARWTVFGLLLVPALNVLSSRQFVAAVEPYLGSILFAHTESQLWLWASSASGVSLSAAWLILIAAGISRAVRAKREPETTSATESAVKL